MENIRSFRLNWSTISQLPGVTAHTENKETKSFFLLAANTLNFSNPHQLQLFSTLLTPKQINALDQSTRTTTRQFQQTVCHT